MLRDLLAPTQILGTSLMRYHSFGKHASTVHAAVRGSRAHAIANIIPKHFACESNSVAFARTHEARYV